MTRLLNVAYEFAFNVGVSSSVGESRVPVVYSIFSFENSLYSHINGVLSALAGFVDYYTPYRDIKRACYRSRIFILSS